NSGAIVSDRHGLACLRLPWRTDPLAKASPSPSWQRALIVLTGTIITVVVVACLYWAQAIFMPVALAIFLTFLLSPVVTWFQRRGLGRVPAVLLVVVLAGLLLGGIIWLVGAQVTSLAAELPEHTANIKAKVRALKDLSSGSVTERLEAMIQ